MNDLAKVAPLFVEMAHRIVWCSAATVDRRGRPRSRVLHPLWHWDGQKLSGWIATSPTRTKRAHLAVSSHVSLGATNTSRSSYSPPPGCENRAITSASVDHGTRTTACVPQCVRAQAMAACVLG